MSYFFRLLSVASHCYCHFATRAFAGLHRRGWDVEMKLFREHRRLFTGWWCWRRCRCSVSCLLRSFWLSTLRRISGRAMGDARQHVEVWSSSWYGGTRPSSSQAGSSGGCFGRSFARVFRQLFRYVSERASVMPR